MTLIEAVKAAKEGQYFWRPHYMREKYTFVTGGQLNTSWIVMDGKANTKPTKDTVQLELKIGDLVAINKKKEYLCPLLSREDLLANDWEITEK